MLQSKKVLFMCIILTAGLIFIAGQVKANDANSNENVNTNTSTQAVDKWEQELSEITDPGILPDSPLFILKTWWEDVQMFFTFDSAKKAELQVKLATRRVVEAKKLVEKGKTEQAEQHLWKFRNRLEKALQKTEQLSNQGKDVSELIEKLEANNIRQQEVLAEVYDKVPESAKDSILNAMEKSARGLENAIEKVQASEDAQQFKTELKNRIKNLNTNKALEIRERLELKGVFGGEGNGDTNANTNTNTNTPVRTETETQTQNQGVNSNIQTETQTQNQQQSGQDI